MTVSRVVRGDPLVSEEKRAMVQKVINEMGYVPDSIAGSLSSRRSGFVALMVRKISTYNPLGAVAILDEMLEQEGLQLLIGNAGHTLLKEEVLIEAMLRRRPEAFVLRGGTHTERTRKLLKSAGIPIIETFEMPEDPIDHVVGFSFGRATKDLVHHLYQRGYRNIAYIGGTSSDSTKGTTRWQSYLEAVQELGLGRGIVLSVDEPVTMKEGSDAVVRLVSEFPQADAVICSSDLLAFGAVMECHRRGWKVPDKIAIAGIGNAEIAAMCEPGITSIGADASVMGREMANVLLAALRAERKHQPMGPSTHLVDIKIYERDSTRPVSGRQAIPGHTAASPTP